MEKFDYTKLKLLREEKGITQKQMGELLFMTQSNYSKLESGHKKIDSLQTIENVAGAFDMTRGRLIGVLAGQENIESSGIKVSELIDVEEILGDKPLRQDEFVLFSTEVLELEEHDFKEYYSGQNLNELSENDLFPIQDYPPEMNIIKASLVELGYNKQEGISLWLGDKKLGVIAIEYASMVDKLINNILISRAVVIENEEGIAGVFDSYMKVVFIVTNAVNKSAQFKKGRFTSCKFLSEEEIIQIDNEASDYNE